MSDRRIFEGREITWTSPLSVSPLSCSPVNPSAISTSPRDKRARRSAAEGTALQRISVIGGAPLYQLGLATSRRPCPCTRSWTVYGPKPAVLVASHCFAHGSSAVACFLASTLS